MNAISRHGLGGALAALIVLGTGDAQAADMPAGKSFLPLLQQGAGQPSQALIDAAKKEGGLVWYDSATQDQAQQMMKAFQAKYPFITRLSHVQLVAGDITTRVAQEAQAGRPTADVVSNAAELLAPLEQRKLIASIDVKAMAIPPELASGDLVVTSTTAYGIQYNTKLLSAADAPKSWQDLLDPKWKGKIALWALPAPFVNLIPVWGADKTTSYVQALMAQKPQIFQSVFEMTSAVASGQLPVGIGVDRLVATAKKQGSPTDFISIDPLSVSVLYSAVVAKGADPNAGRLFISWISSEAGAKVQELATDGRANPQIPGTAVRTAYVGKTLSGWPPGHVDEVGNWSKKFSAILAGN